MRYLMTYIFCLSALAGANAQENVRWISNALFTAPANSSVYGLCADDKPTIIALGNIRSQAAEHLFETGALQKLAREHGVSGDNYSMRDIHIAFVNITVFPGDEVAGSHLGIPVYNLPESSEVLDGEGWSGLYRLDAPRLYMLTPDHLIFPLSGGSADELYGEARAHCTRLRPGDAPDIRLLSVQRASDAGDVQIQVQNFSRMPLTRFAISLHDGAGKDLITKDYSLNISSLDAATVLLPLPPEALTGTISVMAIVADDVNPGNNVWTGSLKALQAPVVAGMSASR